VKLHDLDSMEEKEIVPGFNVKFVHSDNMTLGFWNVDADAVMPDHSHPHEQIVNIIEGRFELTVAGETRELKAGSSVVLAPDVKHSGKALTSCRIIDAFYPVREEYR
jgi:quercetin dioxygenase-like cupin family protein